MPIEIVAVGNALALWITGVLDFDQALAGFGDPVVVYIAALFIVTNALEATGLSVLAGQRLGAWSGSSALRLLVLTMVICAFLSALISVNAAVAALVPVAVVTAVRLHEAPSRLLMPLAFAGHAGSMLALTGAPKNIIVSEASRDAGTGYFGFFEFALVGIPLLVGTVAIVVLVGHRLLPTRDAHHIDDDFRDHAATLLRHYGLDGSRAEPLYGEHSGVVEVVIRPRSQLIGETVFPGMVTESGELVVLAVHRGGAPTGSEPTVLVAGDSLLLEGTWRALSNHLDDPDVLVVDSPDEVRRQTAPFGRQAKLTLVIVVVMVALLATGSVPPAAAALFAAGALVLTRVVDLDEAYKSIPWNAVVLVAGMIPLATAMTVSGAADELAERLVDIVGDAGPYPLLIGLFVLTAALGQLISNTATILIVIPVALAAAAELDVSPRPVLMSLNVVASAAVLTPVATPANLMVMGPGGYRFGDYARLGLPLLLWYFVAAVGLVPLIWRL